MSKFRRAARIDSNQNDIVNNLRKMGYSVDVGHDDILVGKDGVTFWYEIKQSEKAVVKPGQKKLSERWKGHYRIVSSIDQILDDMKKGK